MALSLFNDGFAVVGGYTYFHRQGKRDRVEFLPHKLGETAGHCALLCALDLAGTKFLVRHERGSNFSVGPLRVWTPDTDSVVPAEGTAIHDAVLAPNGTLVVLATEDGKDGEMFLFEAKVEGTRLALEKKIELPAPVRADYYSLLFGGDLRSRRFEEDRRKKDAEEGEDDESEEPLRPNAISIVRGGFAEGAIALFANVYGVALGSSFRGVVAVLDPKTLAPRLSARVPSEEAQFQVFAAAAPGGAIVTAVANYRQSEIVFLGDDGAVRATRDKNKKDALAGINHAALVLDDSTVLSGDGDGNSWLLALPTLKPKAVELEEPNGLVSALDGKRHLVSCGDHESEKPDTWSFFSFEGGKKTPKEIELREILEPPPVHAAPIPSSGATGVARLCVSPKGAWTATVGKDTDIPLTLTNLGGPCAALRMVAGGPAFDGGLVALLTERIESSVPPGILTGDSKRPIEPSSTQITVKIRGLKAGSALFTIRLIPDTKAKTTEGSALCGRPITVA